VEIDTNPERCDLHALPFEMMNQLDLVLFEYVNDPQNGGVDLDELYEVRKHLNIPCGLCHWDIDRIFPDMRPEDLAERLEHMDLFVEISTSDFYRRNGMHLYELGERFFKAFKGRVRLSIGTDSHRRIDEVVNIGKGQAFVRRLGLQEQMLFH
jgi:histidinol phosphatase-like PHP family hydrolase